MLYLRRSIILFIVLGLVGIHTHSLALVNLPKALQRVLLEPGGVTIIRQSANPVMVIADLPKSFESDGQNLIKTAEGLFMIPEGTGRIYKWVGDVEGEWKRIDSTYFTGYNYGALVFNLGKDFFSFGGQGFWNTNGNLRYYSADSKEWNVQKLNLSFPWFRKNYATENLFQLDTTNKKLYVVSAGVVHDQAIKNRSVFEKDGAVMVLDLKTGDWKKLGIVPDSFYNVMAILPWGMLVNNHDVVDLINNKSYRFSDALYKKWEGLVLRSTGNHELDFVFAIDSIVYLGDYGSRLDSFPITKAELIPTSERFYQPEKQQQSGSHMWVAAIIMMVMTPIMVHFIIRKKRPSSRPEPAKVQTEEQVNSTIAEISIYRSSIQANMLDEQEVLLLQYILGQSQKTELSSIEQINQLLGISNRSGEVQKRTRSVLISGINEKLQIALSSMDPIIEKKRSEFDKRSYEYFMLPKYFKQVEEILNAVNKNDG